MIFLPRRRDFSPIVVLFEFCFVSKMHSSTVLFVALFSSLSQQLSDSKHGDLMRRQYAVIQARQFGGPDLSFCYGETAICSECNILFDKCDAFEFQDDPTQWYQCLCGNGYVEADKESVTPH